MLVGGFLCGYSFDAIAKTSAKNSSATLFKLFLHLAFGGTFTAPRSNLGHLAPAVQKMELED